MELRGACRLRVPRHVGPARRRARLGHLWRRLPARAVGAPRPRRSAAARAGGRRRPARRGDRDAAQPNRRRQRADPAAPSAARAARANERRRVQAGPARARRRDLRLPAAQRELGPEQRRSGQRPRRIAAHRHALRPAADERDAGVDGAAARREPDRRRVQHPRRSRPLLRQPDAGSGVQIHATNAASAAMRRRSAAAVREMLGGGDLDPVFAAFARERFGPFDFEGIEQRLPDATFDGRLELRVGDRVVELIELGPAHSEGDAIAHVAMPASCSPAISSSPAARPSSGRARSRGGWARATQFSRLGPARSCPGTGPWPMPARCTPCSATCDTCIARPRRASPPA